MQPHPAGLRGPPVPERSSRCAAAARAASERVLRIHNGCAERSGVSDELTAAMDARPHRGIAIGCAAGLCCEQANNGLSRSLARSCRSRCLHRTRLTCATRRLREGVIVSKKQKTVTRLRSGAAISAAVAAAIWGSRVQAQEAPATASDAAPESTLQEVVVTGTTSKDRTVLTSSADIIALYASDLEVKAPRSTDEVLELVPGMFVEDTAGAVSNNYSVRGLPGGGQAFVQMMEDGLVVAYPGTGHADELFSYDINVKSVEAVLGGSSGVLTPNGAGATINWITRRPNFTTEESIVRASTTTYADRRVDFYYSHPIVSDLAFNFGGYLENNRGTRDAGITYGAYHLKGEIEKKWDNGASLILSGKIGDQHDPYYADMPFNWNGSPQSIPGTDALKTNIAGPAFGNIDVPTSCVNGCYRTFSLNKGIEAV